MSELSEAEEAAVEVLEELTEEEASERHRLELKVERAFFEAGVALREIRDRRLYRSTHKTFEDYVKQRFGYSRVSAHYKIAAASVVENLLTNGEQILPTSERQVRDIIKHSPESQCFIWSQGIEEAGGQVPTSRIVKGIVERLKSKPLVLAQDFCQVGDMFILTLLVEEQRKYNRCWAIAKDVSGINVNVDVHDTTLIVKPENLKPIDSPDARRQLPQILKRIRRLRNCGLLDRGAHNVLEDLGRHIYLTPVEEGLLQWLENHYGVVSEEN